MVDVEFTLPSLGADMEKGRVARWCKHDGEALHRGDTLVQVETDKGLIDVECFVDGVFARALVAEGTEVNVGTPIALLHTETSSSAPSSAPSSTTGSASSLVSSLPAAAPARTTTPTATPSAATLSSTTERGRVYATPLARRRAAELGIDIERVVPADGARIGVDDVLRAAQQPVSSPSVLPPSVLSPSVLSPSVLSPSVLSPSVLPPSVSAVAVHTAVTSPVSPTSSEATAALRRAIAVTMARSKREIPHYYLWQRVDLWTTLAWLDEENARRPVTMRVLPIVLVARAVARAARAFPDLNGTLHDGAYFAAADVNLCFATSLRGGGLVAPALAGADRLDVEGLRLGLAGLVARVRGGGLSARELTSGTLTLSNLGDLGVDGVLPVIQPPQVAIVGVGRITQAAVVDRGAVVAHPVVTLTLAADHRVSDGQRGARFLRAIEDHLLHPERP